MAGCFDYYAEAAEKLDARQYTPIDVGHPDFEVSVRREPLGVVGLITPWNYPLLVRICSPAPPALRCATHAAAAACLGNDCSEEESEVAVARLLP